jgi:hypothetical protein
MNVMKICLITLATVLFASASWAGQPEVARLEAAVPQAFAHFGGAVAIDGTTIVVGAEDDPAREETFDAS